MYKRQRMAEVSGVRFKNTGKVYYFDPQGIQVEKGSMAIVETARGLECGEVALANREVADESIVQPLRRLIRLALSLIHISPRWSGRRSP